MSSNVLIRPELTPNPASVRFMTNQKLLAEGSAQITSMDEANQRSPLAARLFSIEGVQSVLIGASFVTVTATADVDWRQKVNDVDTALRNHFASGQPVLIGEPDPMPDLDTQNEITRGIQRVIDEEIRPAVAMDGGDVVFCSYENGIVRLQMRGACSGCPSSTMTLKMGIERRLREEFPEIIAVEAL